MTKTTYIFTKTEPPFHTTNIQEESSDISILLNALKAGDWISHRTTGRINSKLFPNNNHKILIVRVFYCHVARSRPLLYRIHTDASHGGLSLQILPATVRRDTGTYFQQSPMNAFFVFDKAYLYWECFPECICVPSDNPAMYKTLPACQAGCYSTTRNKRVYLANSSEIVYRMLQNYNDQTPKKEDNILYKEDTFPIRPWTLSSR